MPFESEEKCHVLKMGEAYIVFRSSDKGRLKCPMAKNQLKH